MASSRVDAGQPTIGRARVGVAAADRGETNKPESSQFWSQSIQTPTNSRSVSIALDGTDKPRNENATKKKNAPSSTAAEPSSSFQSVVLRGPPLVPLGIEIERNMPIVSRIQLTSPLFGRVKRGDILVFVDGRSTAEMSRDALMGTLNSSGHAEGLELTLLWRQHGGQQATTMTPRAKSGNDAKESPSLSWSDDTAGSGKSGRSWTRVKSARKPRMSRELSEAGKHFAKAESERQLEIEALMNAPPSPAAAHFERRASLKLQKAESNRALAREKPREEPLPADFFFRLNEKRMGEKTKSQRDLAESVMPQGVKHFTFKAEKDRADKLSRANGNSEEMPVATKYFNRLALEKEAEKKRKQEERGGETMPAAIQKFTMEAHNSREKRKEEHRSLRENPPPLSPGQAYFNTQVRDEAERKRAAREERRETAPVSPAAFEHFAKIESQRKLVLDAQKEQRKNSGRDGSEPSVASRHFEKRKSMRAQEIVDRREEVKRQYFEKQRSMRSMQMEARHAQEEYLESKHTLQEG